MIITMKRMLGTHDARTSLTGVEPAMDRVLRQGRVKTADPKTHLITFDDTQSGESDLVGIMLTPLYNVETKEGTVGLPTNGSRIVYFRTGGNIQIILGCLGGPIPIPGRSITDDQQTHNGYESYINLTDVGLPLADNIPYLSDFGHDQGDHGFIGQHGKIKLKASGIIVLRSGDLCTDYMIPEAAHRMRHALWDEERIPGLQQLRKTFISSLDKDAYSALYDVLNVTDNPISPTYLLREEKGFTDLQTSLQSTGWTSAIDLSGPIGRVRAKPQTILNSTAVKRRKVYSVQGSNGQITSKSPVYKKEWRNDGSVIEEVGSSDGGVTYLIKVTKTSAGLLQVVLGTGNNPVVQIEMNQRGEVDIVSSSKIALKSNEVDIKASVLNLNANIINISGNTAINVGAPTVAIDGATSTTVQSEGTLALNAPSVTSLPTTTPVIITPPADPVPTPANLMPNPDNQFES